MYKLVNHCPITNQTDKTTYLDLGLMPLVNNLNSTKEESLDCPRFPLKINLFHDSRLSVLSHIIDPNILFQNYVYKSGTSQPYIEHCREMFDYISKFVEIKKLDTFIDIGGNDGTLLFEFWKRSTTPIFVVNVDPSTNLTDSCRLKNIHAITSRWNSDSAKIATMEQKAKVITSTNVFQHTEDIRDFVVSIRNSLADDGVWCLEFPYWKKDLETHQYDQTYHEHIYYYLVTPLNTLFNQEGLKIIDISEHPIHGGTLRLIIKKDDTGIIDSKVIDYMRDEIRFDLDYYMDWSNKIQRHMFQCERFIYVKKSQGYKIAGFGAAAKGCIFLNSCRLDHEIIDYVVDDTDLKQGKFIPGTGIEIVSRERLIQNPPDYILILAHNFADYIMKSLRPIYKGRFLVMFPTVQEYE